MTKKQSDYLASLLGNIGDSAPQGGNAPQPAASPSPMPDKAATDLPAPRSSLSLLGRDNALARVANGEVRQVTQLLLDPKRVRIWTGNARLQAQLTEENCRDLIDSIIAEGGQKVPVVLRHIKGDPAHDYELIAGTRRHYAISWLRAHNYPDMRLLAQVADLDDEAAFRLADIENRARKDVSDIERARNYASALDRHYGGTAVRMAERLNLSKGWLSKMLKAATIPDSILGAFTDLQSLSLNPAYKLAMALDDPARAGAIHAEAQQIIKENEAAQAENTPPLSFAATLQRLMTATASPLPPRVDLGIQVTNAHGRPILAIKSINRQGITVHLPMASGAGDDQLAQALKSVLEQLRQNGVTVA